MAVSQISVFLENKPGHLKHILDTFAAGGINVCGFSISDTGDYGIARFILDKPEAALQLLREHQCATALTDILCVRLPNRPGELARLMGIFAEASINVPYSYPMSSTVIAVHVDASVLAGETLRRLNFELVSQDDISAGRA